MRINKATLTDLEAINFFDIFAGDRGVNVERGECFVATDEDQVVGYVVSNHSFYLKPFVQFLCLRPESRRRGTGRFPRGRPALAGGRASNSPER